MPKLMKNQNDTIKLKSWNLKEVDGNHWAEHHVIYGVDDTIVISLRKPMGLISMPETCRYTPVWVTKSELITIPGRMKFGEDTLQPGLEKTELPLDGIWAEIPVQKTLLNYQPPFSTYEPQPAPLKMRTVTEVPFKINHTERDENWNIGMNSCMFTFLLAATTLYIVSSTDHWKCYLKELFLPLRKRKIW